VLVLKAKRTSLFAFKTLLRRNLKQKILYIAENGLQQSCKPRLFLNQANTQKVGLFDLIISLVSIIKL